MNNSVFGKTMKNLTKRVDVRLITDEKQAIKLASKPTFVSSKIFNENLIAIHKIKETVLLNRPANAGMCILDISKISIIIISNRKMAIKRDCFSLTQVHSVMKLKQQKRTKISGKIKINLILAIIMKQVNSTTRRE